jgi:hypothetical protein
MPIESKMSRKSAGERSDQQNMVRFLHDAASCRNRVRDPFERGDGSGFEVGSFHNSGIHTLHPVQLAIRSSPRIEQSRLLQEADCRFSGIQCWASLRKDAVACLKRVGQTGSLRRC